MSGIYRPVPSPFLGGRQPLEPKRLPVEITLVPENDPPFSARHPLWDILLAAWLPGPPLPPRAPLLLFDLGTLVNEPPFKTLVAPQAVLVAWLPPPPRPEPIRARPTYFLSRDIRGVTRDLNGNRLSNCVVKCFETLTDALVFTTMSDANGDYAGTVPTAGQYYLVAYKVGGPDVAGTTLN